MLCPGSLFLLQARARSPQPAWKTQISLPWEGCGFYILSMTPSLFCARCQSTSWDQERMALQVSLQWPIQGSSSSAFQNPPVPSWGPRDHLNHALQHPVLPNPFQDWMPVGPGRPLGAREGDFYTHTQLAPGPHSMLLGAQHLVCAIAQARVERRRLGFLPYTPTSAPGSTRKLFYCSFSLLCGFGQVAYPL